MNKTLPCCGYNNPEAVKWNPHNEVVQCHNCGQVYTPQRQDTPAKAVEWVGLTPQERDEINEQVYGAVPHHVAFAHALEAKLKEKNMK